MTAVHVCFGLPPRETVVFTVHDQCDYCGAQAKARAIHDNGQSLQFCGHHAKTYWTELFDQGFSMFLGADEKDWFPLS